MAQAVRWGILGAGGIAASVGADVAASPGSVVAAVASRDLDRAVVLADRLGAARAYGSYDELVADPGVDVVYVTTTHAQHHAAARRGLLCLEGMWARLDSAVRRIRQIVESGEIGELRAVRAHLCGSWGGPWTRCSSTPAATCRPPRSSTPRRSSSTA